MASPQRTYNPTPLPPNFSVKGQTSHTRQMDCPAALFDSTTIKKHASMPQILQDPFSRGSVHIRPSSGPDLRSNLTINPGFFSISSGHLDLTIALHAHGFSEETCTTQPLSWIHHLLPRLWPQTEDTGTDDGLTRFMGGWTGARGGVYGVWGLRAVDASVVPL
ncbi:hypothetical protein VTI74DRAFT_6140 [Chaetomium olivicolor]